MSGRGSNLPEYRAVQLGFAANIRDPDNNPVPEGIESRRMQIYQDLFYNNIEGFLASGFPVAKQVLGESQWHGLVREFVHRHPSESPYFLEISQEFLTFLGTCDASSIPGFLLELCHYEWVELALSVNETEIPETGFDQGGDLLDAAVAISPLIWCLAYNWPVHEIGPAHVPTCKPELTTELIVYRRRDDQVKFMVVNPVTLRLVDLLQSGSSGRAALESLARELPELDSNDVYEHGLATLTRLRDAQIILGSQLMSE